jgi:prepilin signal peptidase PulO-like enzyme (type II secretory pathway)
MLFPSIVVFILGTIFGSFISVVIYRIHAEKKGIFWGKSECPYCHKRLNPLDLIPIFSYLIRGGKCSKCKKHISIHYLLLELLTGTILLGLFLKFPFIQFELGLDPTADTFSFDLPHFINFASIGIISLFLIAIFFYDLKHKEIPEIFTLPAIAIVFLVMVIWFRDGFAGMAIGGAIAGLFFGLQVWISKEKWLGAGDTQVGILMGMLLGWKLVIVAIMLSYIIGSLVSIFLLLAGKVTKKSTIPFAPFLVTGTFIAIFAGDYIINSYLQILL